MRFFLIFSALNGERLIFLTAYLPMNWKKYYGVFSNPDFGWMD